MTEKFVKFNGTNASVEAPEVVKLGDRIEFSGAGVVSFIGDELRGDGEERPVLTLKVQEVELGDVSPAPEDPQLDMLADDDSADD